MNIDSSLIETTSHSAKELAELGQHGFILFAIIVVAAVFGLMIFITYKSYKTLLLSHRDNEEKIEEANKRIFILEKREDDCVKRLNEAANRLEKCIEKLEQKEK